MRLGISSGLAHTTPKEWAEQLKKLGCRSVVFPVNYLAQDEVIDAYVQAAKEQDLVIAEVGIWNNALSDDLKERKKNRDYAIGQLKLADRIGARCCVNIAGTPVGTQWDGGYKENFSADTWRMTVESIQEIIDAVKPKHTKFSIEPMPWMVPTGPDEYLKLIQDVDREAFAVHMDLINMINCPQRYFFMEAFIEECFTKLKGKICSCHLKDIKLLEQLTFQLKECACGEGNLPLQCYLDAASKEDGDMPMLIEHLANDSDYVSSMKYVQKYME